MVNLHFLGLIEALQECNSTILSKVCILTLKSKIEPSTALSLIFKVDIGFTKCTRLQFVVVPDVDPDTLCLQQPGEYNTLTLNHNKFVMIFVRNCQ